MVPSRRGPRAFGAKSAWHLPCWGPVGGSTAEIAVRARRILDRVADAKYSDIYFGPPDTKPLAVEGPPSIVLDNLANARAGATQCRVLLASGSREAWVNPERVTFVLERPDIDPASYRIQSL